MDLLWRVIDLFAAGVESLTARLRRADPGSEQGWALARLHVYREAAGDLAVARRDVENRPVDGRSIQAALCLGVATVLKIVADSLSLFVETTRADLSHRGPTFLRVGGAVAESDRRIRLFCGFYQTVLRLVEQARVEMTRPGEPHPLDPEEFFGEAFLSEPLDHLEMTSQRLEEAFELETATVETDRPELSGLLARLRSKSSVASELTTSNQVGRRGLSFEQSRWTAELYRKVFRLWILVSQELVRPGITGTLSEYDDDPDPADPFLMTEPAARARYEREGRLDELERDIRFEVMRGRPWSPTDLEYLQEVMRLQSSAVLRPLASFWHVSPHPTVFRALRKGTLSVAGKTYRFRRGEDIVWVCPMLRDAAFLESPVLIGRFDAKRINVLCGAMSNAMLGKGPRTGMGSGNERER